MDPAIQSTIACATKDTHLAGVVAHANLVQQGNSKKAREQQRAPSVNRVNTPTLPEQTPQTCARSAAATNTLRPIESCVLLVPQILCPLQEAVL